MNNYMVTGRGGFWRKNKELIIRMNMSSEDAHTLSQQLTESMEPAATHFYFARDQRETLQAHEHRLKSIQKLYINSLYGTLSRGVEPSNQNFYTRSSFDKEFRRLYLNHPLTPTVRDI